jgi:hypothetical protein
MAKGNAGIGICSRRRSELSVGTGPAPLYVGMEIYNSAVFWHCFVASLRDGLMDRRRGLDYIASTKLVSAAGCFRVSRNAYYRVLHSRDGRVIGCAHIEAMEYTEKMPMLPGLSIGLIPIAQMLFLPPLIFRIVAVLGSRKIWKSSKS